MSRPLQISEQELFSITFKNAPIGMAIVSNDGKWLQVNSALCQLSGYSEAELLGMTVQDLTHPVDKSVSLDLLDRFLDGKLDFYQTEKRYIHKNGFIVWVLLVLSTIRDDHGQPLHCIAQIQDITESKFAEKELKAKTKQLESFINHNADAIWMINEEESVLEVNPAFEKMFGWSASEILGKRLPLIPDFLKDAMAQIHEWIKSGETVVGMDTIRQHKDGRLLNVEATLSPLCDHHGAIIGITGICRNITPRKMAEKELQAKTSQLESFINHNADSIIIFNNDCLVQRVNETFEHVFGWSKELIIGNVIFMLPIIPVESINDVANYYERVSNGQTVVGGIETVLIRKNGEAMNVILTASPILDGRDNQNGWSVTIRDITEWKAAQEHMKNAEKLSVAGQLAAGIAHEIRNPITSIKGFVQLMKAGFGEKQMYFDIMTSEIDRIELILSELLILAKPQTIKYERKDIRVLLSQVMTLLDSQANLNNIQFTTEYKPGVTHLYCDENQLKQVFINFIKNSIESMPNGGNIIIQIKSDTDQELSIRLIDEGCGIPKEVLSKLGLPFYTTKDTGTGLGFMVSKKIIENHAGRIKVESEVDKGTVIEIILPLYY
ncbi:PAS domain S-box protein [Paenibacillus sp. BC26]|uniref:PAS domain S-box protein n=1 Tax=Paenibacillus sp. BC26 TaxID=1881032 RepID=UPI0008EB8EB8|nr:PAS domain S-box protein [Paenibacillus sp. BC26]SFS65493.1 two-component system, sporulation sensor kinase A [Paenibacillus sp. BC26]